MPLILQGATSGQATVQATDAATVTLTLPATSGTLVTTGGAQTIEFADGSASAPSITNSGDTNTGIFFPAADTIAFTEGGAEIARFDSSGTFIVGPFGGNGNAVVAGSSSPSFTNQPGTNLLLKSGDGSGTGSSFMSFSTSPAGSSGTTVNTAVERMRIDSSGNVGIGKTNPSQKLDVSGNLQVQGTNSFVYVDAGGASGSALKLEVTGSTSVAVGADSNHPLLFKTNAAERMRIDSNGYLLVGCTQTPSSTISGIRLSNPASAQCVFGTGTGTGVATVMAFVNGNGQVGRIDTSGSNAVYVTTSDYRLKENIAPMTGALAKVTALKPCTYKWKSSGEDSQGFIAHELAEVVPECVVGEKDGMRTERYEVSPAIEATFDEEGNELTPAVEAVMGEREVPDYQGIDTSFLVATLTAAIQELKATVDAQAARIAALEGAK